MIYEYAVTTQALGKQGEIGETSSPEGDRWELRSASVEGKKLTCLWFRPKQKKANRMVEALKKATTDRQGQK